MLKVIGASPLKWLFAGLAPLLVLVAELSLLASLELPFYFALLCSVVCVCLAVIFDFWRPAWSLPPWLRDRRQ